jgi:hypothetical protein
MVVIMVMLMMMITIIYMMMMMMIMIIIAHLGSISYNKMIIKNCLIVPTGWDKNFPDSQTGLRQTYPGSTLRKYQ